MNAEYEARMIQIRDRIHELRLLRDAQTPDSRNHRHFQEQINTLTTELLSWEDNAPRLDELDSMVNNAHYRVVVAQQEADNAAGAWTRLAATCGVLGGLLVLVSLVWTPTAWMPIIGGVLLAAAVAAVFLSVRARRESLEDVHQAQLVLVELREEREALLPTDQW